MTRIAWATDIHFDSASPERIATFCAGLADPRPTAVLIAGDIGTATTFELALFEIASRVEAPVYFVLGNHDFYGSNVAEVRGRAAALSREGPVAWLGARDVVALDERAGLVGHDGWGDARFGDHYGSQVVLNDFLRIQDLAGLDKRRLGEALGRLGDESAAHLRRVLPPALQRFEHVVVLTHVPPFREASWHEGEMSSDDFLPYFACKATGDVLLDEASRHPHRRITVLCGHTHSAGEVHPLPNLRVVTGAARYGSPGPQPSLEV